MDELKVGLEQAAIVAIIVMQALAFYENQRRVTAGGSDSAINGAIALFQVKREARMAGFGLTSPSGLICPLGINVYYNGTTVLNGGNLVPLAITEGASGAPDQIRFARSQSTYGIAPAIIVKAMPNPSSIVTTDSTAGIKNNDLFLTAASNGGKICTLMQATKDAQATGNGWDLQHNQLRRRTTRRIRNSAFTVAPSYVVGDIVVADGQLRAHQLPHPLQRHRGAVVDQQLRPRVVQHADRRRDHQLGECEPESHPLRRSSTCRRSTAWRPRTATR